MINMEHLNKTTGLLIKNNSFIGSSVVFPYEGEFLCLTAGHNLYGKKFDQILDLTEWCVSDYKGVLHKVSQCIGDVNFARENDIVILKLECNSNLELFHCPQFYTVSKNPAHSFFFRGKYETSKFPVTHTNLQFINLCQNNIHKFYCKIEKALLMNNIYQSGSDWLGGWSGSGLFLANHDKLICFGVMIEIPNKGNDGQLKFTSISAIDKLDVKLNIIESSALDFDNKLLASSVNSIFEQTDDKAISLWENDEGNKPQLDYIVDKLTKVYSDDRLEIMKRNAIRRLLVGKAFLYSELRKHEIIYDQYNKAYYAYDLDDLEVNANTRTEANSGLKQIKKEYEDYLISCLGDVLGLDDIKILSNYGISEWISNCSLSFIKDE